MISNYVAVRWSIIINDDAAADDSADDVDLGYDSWCDDNDDTNDNGDHVDDDNHDDAWWW